MNEPVRWTPRMILIATPIVLAGVLGLILFGAVVLVLLGLGLKPVSSL